MKTVSESLVQETLVDEFQFRQKDFDLIIYCAAHHQAVFIKIIFTRILSAVEENQIEKSPGTWNSLKAPDYITRAVPW